MGLIKEPLNVDFYFENRQMTDEDQKRVTAFIAKQKGVKQRRVRINDTGKSKGLVGKIGS